jgi:hypothetical protein
MVKKIKPVGVVVRHYYDPITNKKIGNVSAKSLFTMKEDKTGETKKEIIKLLKILQAEGYAVDSGAMIDDLSFYKNRNLVLCLKENDGIYKSKAILYHEILHSMAGKEKEYQEKDYGIIEFYFEDFKKFFKTTFEYHKDIKIKKNSIGTMKIVRKNDMTKIPSILNYEEYIKLFWNSYALFYKSHYYYKDKKDDDGNLILFYKLLKEGGD